MLKCFSKCFNNRSEQSDLEMALDRRRMSTLDTVEEGNPPDEPGEPRTFEEK